MSRRFDLFDVICERSGGVASAKIQRAEPTVNISDETPLGVFLDIFVEEHRGFFAQVAHSLVTLLNKVFAFFRIRFADVFCSIPPIAANKLRQRATGTQKKSRFCARM